jgi:carbamoyltransferase
MVIHLKIKEELKGFEKINQIRSVIPAVTHVDNTARIQTVTKNNTFIYPLIKKFYEKTKYPLLVNTSFNLSEEPIVNNAKDAIHSFKNCSLDVLVINNYYVKK